MKRLIGLSIAMCAVSIAFTQAHFKPNTFYGEIAGNGLVLSVNYERQLAAKPGLGLHAGIGLGGDKPMIPTGAVYLFHLKNTKSYLEAGAGITFGEKHMLDGTHTRSVSNNYIPAFVPSVGLRHHTEYGLMWKIIYSPVFTRYRALPLFGGFSLGWRI